MGLSEAVVEVCEAVRGGPWGEKAPTYKGGAGPEPRPGRRPGEGGPTYKGGCGLGPGARDVPYMYIGVK